MGRWLLVVAVVLATGCLQPELVHCGEKDCPSGSTCLPDGFCATSDQIAACANKGENAECIDGTVTGLCIGGACVAAVCGNGILEPGEVCDDGNRISGDGCSYDCLSDETCGNGYLDFVTGEQCDDGNTVDGDGCEHDCTLPKCGNHVIDPGEVCDDGNRVSGDGCSADCMSNETCGNGYVDVAKGEQCDDGNHTDGDGCEHDCTLPKCGNGVLDPGEVCDDGNRVSGDGCSADCLSNETCGNNYVDAAKGEQCDDGNHTDADGCEHDCTLPFCGNHIIDPGEVCDDGNHIDGDGCSRDCLSNETCGNGIRDPGEECDDGNLVDHDGCQSNCKIERCGDGIVDPADASNGFVAEQCDDGNFDNTDACLNTCKTATCGDGFVWSGHETCDDGNKDNTDGCLNTCVPASCGDGFTWAGHEECDDGNSVNTDCCSNDCKLPMCGNGIIECNEVCDDGLSGNGSNGTCRNNCGLSCPLTPVGIQFVGTGVPALEPDTNVDVASGVGFLDGAFGGSSYAMYGSCGYGCTGVIGYNYYPYVIDLTNNSQIPLQPDMFTDTSQLTGLTSTTPQAFYENALDWQDQPNYCSATGTGTWTPQITLTVYDACGKKQTFAVTGAPVTSSSWPVCAP